MWNELKWLHPSINDANDSGKETRVCVCVCMCVSLLLPREVAPRGFVALLPLLSLLALVVVVIVILAFVVMIVILIKR